MDQEYGYETLISHPLRPTERECRNLICDRSNVHTSLIPLFQYFSLVNAEVENSLDLQLIEFDREMHDFQRDLFKISSGVNQISRFAQQLGQKEDSHDLRAKLNANIEITKDNIQRLNDKLQTIIPKRSSIPVNKLVPTSLSSLL